MKYYKVIVDNSIIGVVSSTDFRHYYPRGGFIGPASEEDGELVFCNNGLYRDNWMRSVLNGDINYTLALINEITETEYNSLHELDMVELNTEELVVRDPEPIIDINHEMTLAYARELKIKELANACQKTIENGLRIGDKYYSFTIDDQLNLLSAENAINSGEQQVLYHANGEEYRYFSAEEIRALSEAFSTWRIYNTLCYKALKNYVNSLDNIDKIINLSFGDEVPNEFKSDILIQFEGE